MTEQYLPNLGQTPAVDARRDAVHIAVAPVVAGQELSPGEHVGFMDDGRVGNDSNLNDDGTEVVRIGIVDPFLLHNVEEGGRCWLFLYPNTVTSLRHVWTHPAFVAKPPEMQHE